MTEREREQAVRFLSRWRDIFVEDMESLPATDLVVNTIPTYPGMRPHRAREPIYAADEIHWQVTMLPQMLRGRIIRRGMSPWAGKTIWVNKKNMEVNGKRFLPKGKQKVIQFISQAFADTETQYSDIERECLAMLRTLEEVRFLALQSRWPPVVYTDAVALVSILWKDDARDRIAGW